MGILRVDTAVACQARETRFQVVQGDFLDLVRAQKLKG